MDSETELNREHDERYGGVIGRLMKLVERIRQSPGYTEEIGRRLGIGPRCGVQQSADGCEGLAGDPDYRLICQYHLR